MSVRRPNGGDDDDNASGPSENSVAAAVEAVEAGAVKSRRDSGATSTAGSGGSAVKSTAKSGGSGGSTVKSTAKSGGSGGPAATEVTKAEATAAAAARKPVEYSPRPARGVGAAAAVANCSCGAPCCVSDGCVKPEGQTACDRRAVKALAQFVTPDERVKVLRWLDALQRLNGMAATDEDDQSERSMYTTCLLMLLQSGRLVAPFTRWPPVPPRPLKSFRDVVDRRLYKLVQIECRRRKLQERTRYERPDDDVDDDDDDDDDDGDDAANRPSNFFDRMPEPCDGVLCYGAAFSDIS